jgi:hypothetical protein
MTEAITNMLNRADPMGLVALLLIFGGGFLVAIVSVVLGFLNNSRKREAEINLKHEMIARGMSADEIERVLAAKSTSGQ